MTHEFKKIIAAYQNAQRIGLQSVLATVVALDGSSYRRPGVQMLIAENGQMTGAVSGGCVEKEVLKQSNSVFTTGIPKMMTYDGRYRLGCEGILYILIEPFQPEAAMISTFENCLQQQAPFEIINYYAKEVVSNASMGSVISFGASETFSFTSRLPSEFSENISLAHFSKQMDPCFRLFIIGAEHDAIQLTQFAALLGWDVHVVAGIADPQSMENFPGAKNVVHEEPENLQVEKINKNCAIILMTHSYVKDLKYLLALKNTNPSYIGLLGPAKRRDKMLNEFTEHHELAEDSFLDLIHGPAGINIGAETPQEIAVSICSEILAVLRQQTPQPLKNKKGTIHCDLS